MSIPTQYKDRTGEKIVPVDGLVDVDILAREETTGIYVVQDVLKSDASMKAGAYFISTEGLEEMIEFFETGVWSGGI